jgi:hypothetical protein
MIDFASYTDAILSALQTNPRATDVIARKQEILDGVYSTHNFNPSSILFIGFSPTILSCAADVISVTAISQTARDYLKAKGVKFTYIP